MTPTVVTVLRLSPVFRPSHVARLYDDVRRNWPGALDFVCLTDVPIRHPGVHEIPLRNGWPGYWSKLNLYEPGVLTGDVLYLDLDVMVVGRLDGFRATRDLTLLASMRKRGACVCNSSVMLLPEDARAPVWDAWIRNPRGLIRRYTWGRDNPYAWGDQGLVQKVWDKRGPPLAFWQDTLPGQVESYKGHVLPRGRVGANTRIVYFHGTPRPWDIGWKLPAREEVAAA